MNFGLSFDHPARDMAQTRTSAVPRPLELSFVFPKIPHRRVNVHLTLLSTVIMVFLSAADIGEGDAASALGSFVYAMPDVCVLITVTVPL